MIFLFILISGGGADLIPSIIRTFTPSSYLLILSSPTVADVVSNSPSMDSKIEIVAIYKFNGIAVLESTNWAKCTQNRCSGYLYHVNKLNPALSVHNSKSPDSWLTQPVECVP